MRYRIRVPREVKADLRRLPGHVRQPISRLIASLASNPQPQGAEPLRECAGYFRIRLSRWRLVYRVEQESRVVTIIRVGEKRGPEFYDGVGGD